MDSKELVDPWQAITPEELAKHNSVEKNDAWMAVRGVVYDVSTYAASHPGTHHFKLQISQS